MKCGVLELRASQRKAEQSRVLPWQRSPAVLRVEWTTSPSSAGSRQHLAHLLLFQLSSQRSHTALYFHKALVTKHIKNNGWLNRAMVAMGGGGKSGRVAGCFVREVPFCFLFSNSDGLTLNGTGNQLQTGFRCHLWKIPLNIRSDVFSVLLPVPERLIVIQFFNPLHK